MLEWHPNIMQRAIGACCTAGDSKTSLEQAQECITAVAPAHAAATEAVTRFVDPGQHANGTAKSRRQDPAVEALAQQTLKVLVPLAQKQLKGVVLQTAGDQELLILESFCGTGKPCDPAKVFKDIPLDEFPTAEDEHDFDENDGFDRMGDEEDDL